MHAVVAALRDHERFVVAAHENPDGDALGSLLAMHLALEQLGKESVMFVPGRRHFPASTRSSHWTAPSRRPPTPPSACSWRSTVRRRAARPGSPLLEESPFTLDIDHHHDNTRFGDVNLIVPDASSTGEILATSSASSASS